MHHIVLDTAAELGVSAKDRRRAIQLAVKEPKRPRPSETTHAVNQGVAPILNSLAQRKRFLRPDGTPRVLSIEGKGVTLETLARRFVPQRRLRK